MCKSARKDPPKSRSVGLVHRMDLHGRDTEYRLGMLRQILWKLKLPN